MRAVFVDNFPFNLGVVYIAPHLKMAGWEVEVLNYPISKTYGIDVYQRPEKYFSMDLVCDQVLSLKPDIICFSVFSSNFMFYKQLTRTIKEKCQIPIIVGGVLPTIAPEMFFRTTQCDFLFRGEAETVIDNVFRSVLAGEWHTIPNLAYRDKYGKPAFNEMKTFIRDLNGLPFYDKNIYANRTNSLFIITSRGCVMACTYCSAGEYSRLVSVPGKSLIRKRSVQDVIKEITQAIAEKEHKEIYFHDDFFITTHQWLEEFSEQYVRHVNLPYRCTAFPATITPNIADLLATSGCIQVDMGFQTANEEYKKTVLKRKESNVQIAKAIQLLEERGIEYSLDHILNLPGETKEHIADSLDFYLDNKIRSISVFFLNYYPKSPLAEYALNNGYITPENREQIENCELIGEQSYKGSIINEEKAREQVKFAFLLRLVNILPARMLRWMMKSGAYQYLPTNKHLYYFISMLSWAMEHGIKSLIITLFIYFNFSVGKQNKYKKHAPPNQNRSTA